MAEQDRQPDKRAIIDALVLAFSHSDIRDVVGTDALRSVLDVEYRDMMTGTRLDLQQLWELLEHQPDFTPIAATPPMCLFKSWESRLGIEVVLPTALQALGPGERAEHAGRCSVPAAELKKLLHEGQADPRTTQKTRRVEERAAEHESSSVRVADPATRRLYTIAAAAVAVLCFGFVGWQVYTKLAAKPAWSAVPANVISGDLPVSEAEQLGDQLGTRLTDDGWLSRPEDERREQLEQALRGLSSRGVQVLFVRDRQGRVRATAQRTRDSIQITFR